MTAPPAQVSSFSSPYIGLRPYAEDDKRFFFGRERIAKIVAQRLLVLRHSILFGPSGVGKSSLLRAGVVPRLRGLQARENVARGGLPELAVAVFSSWREPDPARALAAAVQESVTDVCDRGAQPLVDVPLVAALGDASESVGGDVLVILDHFEEYFVYHGSEDGPGSFADELVAAISEETLRANFLLSIREDALAKLDGLKRRLPRLFNHILRIDNLDRPDAEAVIRRPVERYNEEADGSRGDHVEIEIEAELVDEVIDELSVRDPQDASRIRVETPFVQVVMTRVWDEEIGRGSRVLRCETLRRLGGAQRIALTMLDDSLGTLPPREIELAVAIMGFLVTPSGNKLALASADLAGFAGVGEGELAPVLEKLCRLRVLRPVTTGSEADGRPQFEIFHNVLAAPILDWLERHASQSRQSRQAATERALRLARRRFAFAAAGCVALIFVLAATLVLLLA